MSKSEHFLMKKESICEPQNPVNVTSKGKLISALTPGGRIQIPDILLQNVPDGSKSNVTLWTRCIAGGLLKLQFAQKVLATGFKEVEVVWGKDVFSGAPQHSDAAKFDTLGVSIRAQRDVGA